MRIYDIDKLINLFIYWYLCIDYLFLPYCQVLGFALLILSFHFLNLQFNNWFKLSRCPSILWYLSKDHWLPGGESPLQFLQVSVYCGLLSRRKVWMSCFPLASTLHLVELVLHLYGKCLCMHLLAFVCDCVRILDLYLYCTYSVPTDPTVFRPAWHAMITSGIHVLSCSYVRSDIPSLSCRVDKGLASTMLHGCQWLESWLEPWVATSQHVTTLYRAQLHIVLSCHLLSLCNVIKPIQAVKCTPTRSKWVKMGEIWHSSVEMCWNSWRLPELQSRLHQLLGLQRLELGESSSACWKREQHTQQRYTSWIHAWIMAGEVSTVATSLETGNGRDSWWRLFANSRNEVRSGMVCAVPVHQVRASADIFGAPVKCSLIMMTNVFISPLFTIHPNVLRQV